VLTIAAPLVTLYPSPWALVALAPLLGAEIYKVTILLHDCVHGTLFSSRRWNRIVGGVAAALTGVEFKTFARLHAKHHQRYGRPDDPQGDDYLGLADTTRSQLIIHLLGPLIGLGLGKLLALRMAPGHLLSVAAPQLMIALIVTAGGKLWWLLPFYPVCAATFGLFCSRVRGFCEHAAPPGFAPQGLVRSHAPNRLEALFFYDLGFNYHVEHHLYPTVSSRHLGALRAYLLASADPRAQVSATLVRTIVTRLSAAPRCSLGNNGRAEGRGLGS
jgi:fatty acid desaturase